MASTTKTAASGEFPGFSEEAFTFLKKLKKNNDRDWFLPRKPVFEERLQQPMTQLMLAIEAEMKKSKLPLAVNSKAILSRIYRDIRFSADKSPYHTHLGGMLYRNGKKDTQGALYVHVGDVEQMAAVGFWQPERPVLTNWRLRMQENPKEFLSMIQQLKSKKLALADTYKLQRMPRGFEAEEETAIGEFLLYQSFVIMRPLAKAEVMSAKLPQVIAKFGLDAKALLEYGWAVPGEKKMMFVD